MIAKVLVLLISVKTSSTMAGPPKRERFNAKARQSSVGGSSHKKRRRVKVGSGEDQVVDETIIDPEERRAKAEEDQKRRAVSVELLVELRR